MSGRTLRRSAGDTGPAVEPRTVAETVVDPELPVLTLADLGVLRDVRREHDGTVVVELTPTYSGCPAMGVMRADLLHALHDAGFDRVDVRTVLSPAWSTDWITDEGRRKLAQAGIAPPGAAPQRLPGPVPLDLGPSRRAAACPLCGSPDTEEVSEFGATACTALRRCRECREPFEHVKEI
ncbi:1,2-phenylacetyl-CoA epoxidase subunit PaaD [Blastococcus haudaquaticus]|uniref:Ring-1,2-phenylacetyl-CoA epoxidase subunit PaaD n=1 Tax=Blastococcus haudaquaticus TaxID=1938745 RepID=A0A286H498_9ACTN|nr:1,2-phenylacetyl-CoA epoxidase subunit PaaD [Blastococcus haudaquaticus]SOE02522.1 ring-1,2-phenylacetyl-CoA epoxidase subunit PaaD [Blastococcus haudaquaticus]